MEGFYQESGRGGRDGKAALSVVYFDPSDVSLYSYLHRQNAAREKTKKKDDKNDRNMKALERVTEYCTGQMCRRKFLLAHFGETTNQKTCGATCDYCRNPKAVAEKFLGAAAAGCVTSQRFRMAGARTSGGFSGGEDGSQWNTDFGCEDEEAFDNFGSERYKDSDLDVFGRGGAADGHEDLPPVESGGFVSAKDVLAKYEVRFLVYHYIFPQYFHSAKK